MTYKTIVIDYAPKAKEMAAAIERTANERAQEGWELMTFSVTNSAKENLSRRKLTMKPDKSALDNQTQKEAVQSNRSGSSLAIGLSLGVLIGIIIDDIGLGMMLGVAVGLCIGPAVAVLRKNQKTGEQTSDDEKQ